MTGNHIAGQGRFLDCQAAEEFDLMVIKGYRTTEIGAFNHPTNTFEIM